MKPFSQDGQGHVAIVGCGFTGTSALFQLVRDYNADEITIFEASGRFGPGFAYQPDECGDYLINNTNDDMCLAPENRRAFFEWLSCQSEYAGKVDPKGHLPRAVFGLFLEDSFSRTLGRAMAKGIKINLLPCEVTDIEELPEGGVAIAAGGRRTVCDAVLLTTGRCPDIQPYKLASTGSGAHYIGSHVASSELDSLELDAEVHILGASLSAYDVVNRLFSEKTGCRFERNRSGSLNFIAGPNNRRVVLCSRSGRLKAVNSAIALDGQLGVFTLDTLRRTAGETGLDLQQVSDLIRLEADLQGAIVDWQAVTRPYDQCRTAESYNAQAGALMAADIAAAKKGGKDNFLPAFFSMAVATLWDAVAEGLFSPQAERLYRDHHESAALAFIAPCPIPTAEKLLALHREGRLSIIGGVKDIRLDEDGQHFALAHQFGVAKAKVLVNATSAVDRNVASDRQPALIRNLVANGLLRAHRIGGEAAFGADVDMTNFRLGGARNIYLANMLLWGPGFFTSSAYTMANVVSKILPVLFDTIQPQQHRRKQAEMPASTA